MFSSFFRMGLMLCALAVAGCTTTSQLYNWGPYEKNTYRYFLSESDPGNSINDLEAHANSALNSNERIPPGFWAHLGLLYDAAGQHDKAGEMFVKEKTTYPEASQYMDFLLERLKK